MQERTIGACHAESLKHPYTEAGYLWISDAESKQERKVFLSCPTLSLLKRECRAMWSFDMIQKGSVGSYLVSRTE